MNNLKLSNLEGFGLVIIIIINHIILNFSKSIISNTGSASALNILFIGFIMLLFVNLIIFLLKRFPGFDILDISKYLGGKALQIITGFFFIGYFLAFSSVLLRSFSENLKIIYLDKLPIIIIILFFIFIITIANKFGISTIAKVNLLIIPIVLFCMIFVFIANINNYNFNGLFPLLGSGVKQTFIIGLSNMFAFSSISLLYFLPPMVKDSKSFNKIARVSTIFSVVLFFISILSFLSLFPFIRNSEEIMALYLASRYIEFGRFFQRLDAVFLLIWTIAVISYLCIAISLCIITFKKISNISDHNGIIYCFSGIVYIISLIPNNLAQLNYLEINIFKYIVFMLIFAYSPLVFIFANIKKRLRGEKMKKLRKFLLSILVFFTISLLIFSLSGCYSVQSIDDLAYVVALGIDLGKNNNLELTIQLTFPNSSDSTSTSGETAPTIINSVECASINSGISLLNSYISKEINLSHCKVIIFSESIANKGIGQEIYTLSNQVEIRPDCNIIISKSTAKEYITNSKPELENLVAKYYELTPYSNQYTGHIVNATISSFFNSLSANYSDPVAILGNGNKLSLSDSETFRRADEEFNIVAGENPLITFNRKSENLGVAVFKNDKLVGELTALESVFHAILTNKLESTIISISNPYKENSVIDIALYHHKNTKITANLVNGSPYVKTKISLNARLLSVEKNSESLTPNKIQELEMLINSYLENAILKYQYKTAKIFEADIDGVGENLIKNFKNEEQWKDYNWPANYKNTFFDIEVSTNIKSSFLLSS